MFAALEFKTTSIERQRRAHCSGVTLVELVIAVGLSALAATALLILSVSTGRSLAEMVNYVDLDHYNRVALDSLTRELRQVRDINSFSVNSMTFTDKDGAPLSYVYLPAQRTLNRVKDGQSKPLLEQCDQLQFAIYQRTPIANSFDLITASKLPDCKVVTITWSCSRMIFGHKANTEQGQTAKIVIRNKNEL